MDKYRTLGKRIGAAVIDGLFVALGGWIILFFSMLGGFASPIVSMTTTALVGLAYFVGLHYRFGQTVGKRIVGVRVLDDSEIPIGFGQAVLRNLPQLLIVMFGVSFSTAGEQSTETVQFGLVFINGLTALFSIANVIVFFKNDKHRALHDFIAGTVVVRTDV